MYLGQNDGQSAWVEVPKVSEKIAEASKAEASGGPFDLYRSMDDFGPKASCTRVKMMVNQSELHD